jgi:hypothetical protein
MICLSSFLLWPLLMSSCCLSTLYPCDVTGWGAPHALLLPIPPNPLLVYLTGDLRGSHRRVESTGAPELASRSVVCGDLSWVLASSHSLCCSHIPSCQNFPPWKTPSPSPVAGPLVPLASTTRPLAHTTALCYLP